MTDTDSALCLRASRAMIAAALLAATVALGGCAGGGASGSNSYAMATSTGGGGSTVAFEWIDGPPPQVFDRMVSVLDSESKLRNLSDRVPPGRSRPIASAAISRRRSCAARP